MYESYKDIKKRVQEKKTGRGYRPMSKQWNIQGSIRGRIEAVKARTRCNVCKKLGHWKKECPDRFAKREGQQSGKTDTREVHFCEMEILDTEAGDVFVHEDVEHHKDEERSCEAAAEVTGSASVGDSWTKSHRKLRKALYTPMEPVSMALLGILLLECEKRLCTMKMVLKMSSRIISSSRVTRVDCCRKSGRVIPRLRSRFSHMKNREKVPDRWSCIRMSIHPFWIRM